MVHVVTRHGEKIKVADHIARVSNLFASMMDDNDDDIPLPWSAEQVHQVVHILTMMTDNSVTIHQCFTNLLLTRDLLTAISQVLPLLDFIDAHPAMTLIHTFIRNTFASATTPDDVIRMCYDTFEDLPPTKQHAIFEICLTHFFFSS